MVRGHSNESYKLNSVIYRISKESELIKEAENNIFNCFINYGDSYCNKFIDNKEWNTLFLMQHYGLYTRLLDWTDSFVTAFYFAIKDKTEGQNACIWMIAPMEINRIYKDKIYSNGDEYYENIGLLTVDTLPNRIKNYKSFFNKYIEINSFAIVPRRSNERLVSQNGFFTVQGTNCISLEEEYSDQLGKVLIKINIDADMAKEYNDFLEINGINYFSLYGGVKGLCRYIKNELLKVELNNK